MDRLYYTYLIIKESLDYIPAIEIKGQLEEKYQIKVPPFVSGNSLDPDRAVINYDRSDHCLRYVL